MGSGKTTLGKKLAKRLNIPFIDTDSEIEEQVGKTISLIFEQEGEAYFRQLEVEFIEKLINHSTIIESNVNQSNYLAVVSTGGGMPCFHDNIQKLNQLGVTIYLERSPKELFQRLIQAKEQRPLVQQKSGEELLQYIEEMIEKREPFYTQSQIVLDRTEQTLEHIEQLLSSCKNI